MKRLITWLSGAIAGLFVALTFAAAAGGYNQNVVPVSNEGYLPTYSAAIFNVTPAATPTDVFCLQGSATQTVKVTRVEFNAAATSAGAVDVILVKRTTPNTGAASSVTVTSHDSFNQPAAASAVNYLVNPSALGTGSALRSDEMAVTLSTASAVPNTPFVWNFGTRNSQYVVLHGTSESLCINLNGSVLPTGTAIYAGAEFIAY